jgi:hypothetical protein
MSHRVGAWFHRLGCCRQRGPQRGGVPRGVTGAAVGCRSGTARARPPTAFRRSAERITCIGGQHAASGVDRALRRSLPRGRGRRLASIRRHGLLSTSRLAEPIRSAGGGRGRILRSVRTSSVALRHTLHGTVVIRDQMPLKYLEDVLLPGTTPEVFLQALNDRVFLWVDARRVGTLIRAAAKRGKETQTVVTFSTHDVLRSYGSVAELAPYNTGATFVPSALDEAPARLCL